MNVSGIFKYLNTQTVLVTDVQRYIEFLVLLKISYIGWYFL